MTCLVCVNQICDPPLSGIWSSRRRSLTTRQHSHTSRRIQYPKSVGCMLCCVCRFRRACFTLVWTIPGLWSRRCSSVAAISISLAPVTHTHERLSVCQSASSVIQQTSVNLLLQSRSLYPESSRHTHNHTLTVGTARRWVRTRQRGNQSVAEDFVNVCGLF